MITEEEWDEVEDKIFMEKGENPEPYEVCNKVIENLTKHNSSSKKDCFNIDCVINKDDFKNGKLKCYTKCKFRKSSPS